jgi:DNA-3-methyladenine glycosylase
MFGPAGRAYVYFTYGMHWCLNVAAGPAGEGGGVLLRAGEVLAGLDTARGRRPAARRDLDLARGPARLAAALGVDGSCDGLDLLDPASRLRLRPARGVLAGRRRRPSSAARAWAWRPRARPPGASGSGAIRT